MTPHHPVDPPLDDSERAVLRWLMRPEATVRDCTLEGVAAGMRLDPTLARRALWSLERRRPPLAKPHVDEGLQVQFWMPTYDAADAFE